MIDDNWLLMQRAPKLTGGKFLKMSSSLYNYFRGTLRIFLRDVTRPGPLSYPTQFATVDTALVVSVLDPHPENIGTYRNQKGTITVDFNDFDGSIYVPYYLDVRRLTVGFAMCGIMAGLDTKEPTEYKILLEQVSKGYIEEIRDIRQGKSGIKIRAKEGFGLILDDLLRRAKEQGLERRNMTVYTKVEAGKRLMRYGDLEPSDKGFIIKKLAEPTDREQQMLSKLLGGYHRTKLQAKDSSAKLPKVKAFARKFGSGVSSYPRLRYYALLEGPTKGVQDDWLLEIKELADPATIPGFIRFPKQIFANNAQRVVWIQRHLQEFKDNDHHLGWATLGPMVFRINQLTRYQKGFDHERFLEKFHKKKWSIGDLQLFAYHSGRLLARSHTQIPTLQDSKTVSAITDALGEEPKAFAEETVQFAKAYAKQMKQDFALFKALLKEKGPLLGYIPTNAR